MTGKGEKTMGFLDKLIKGAQMLGEMASEMNTAERAVSGPVHTAPYVPEKSFEEKLQTVLQNAGSYELRNNISPDELEREFGQEIYTRKGCKRPENITYGIYQAGNRVLLIRLWTNYGDVYIFGENGLPLAPFRTDRRDGFCPMNQSAGIQQNMETGNKQ